MATTATPLIRRATVADAAALAALGAETFIETFGHLYPAADLASFLAKSHSMAHYTRMLETPRVAIWVATVADRLVGFASAGPCKLPVGQLETAAGELRQLYVLAEFRQHKLGSRMFDTVLAWLGAEGFSPLYIGVWSENFGAQRFYARYGFEKFGEYGFPVGETIDREFILKQVRT